ncbi:MAG: hypothetical protein ACRDQA_10820 [Nocardioidaceae bacterium]
MRLISKRTGVVIAAAGVIGLVGAGGAYAGSQVTSHQIKNQTIHSIDIARGGVGTSEVRNQSVRSEDIAPGGVGKSEIRSHAVGVDELNKFARSYIQHQAGTGARGPAGQDGTNGVSGYEVVGRTADSSTATGEQTITTQCAPGKEAMGGGLKAYTPADVTVRQTHPSDITMVPGSKGPGNEAGTWYAASWTVSYANAGTSKVQPYVVCADLADAQ